MPRTGHDGEAERRAQEAALDERANKLDVAAAQLSHERAQFSALQGVMAREAEEKAASLTGKEAAMRELGTQMEKQGAVLDERIAAARESIEVSRDRGIEVERLRLPHRHARNATRRDARRFSGRFI